MKLLLILLQMSFVGEVEQKSDSIAFGDTIKTVTFDTLLKTPKISVMESSGEVTITNITKYSCDVKSSDTTGLNFKLVICE